MKKLLIVMLLLITLLLGAAAADEAQDITTTCKISIPNCETPIKFMTDRDRRTTTSDWGKQELIVYVVPGDIPAAGVYIEFGKVILPFHIEVRDDRGRWQTIGEFTDDTYPEAYLGFAPQKNMLRIIFHPKNGKRELAIRELYIVSEGEAGRRYNHVWQPAPEKTDMMVLVAHPGDEILWFGGAIPFYAGEKGMQVEVCYLTGGDLYRELELLNGLWQMGVQNYPDIGNLESKQYTALADTYEAWGRKETEQYIVRLIRKYKPEVLLTLDIKGEGGQPENIACVESSIHAVEMAANPKYDPDSAAEYGEWGVKKVYIHLGAHPTITMDWTRPLTAFDGKSGLEVAETAFQCHESQAGLSREIAYPGTEYDSSLYTLLRSTVGMDIKCDDFFENIPEDSLSVKLQ